MTSPHVVINAALQEAPFSDHEKILIDMLSVANSSDHSLNIEILSRLVQTLNSRISFLETQVQGCLASLAHHKLDL
jgi:hypothetical protein